MSLRGVSTVRVRVPGRPYEVVIGSGMTARLPKALRRAGLGPMVGIVSDAEVARRWMRPLVRELVRGGFRPVTVIIQPGERRKSLRAVDAVAGQLLRGGLGRDGSVLAFGGGVVGDLAGFVAATYQRGLPVVQVPTTLLAQVDSSIGGKVGVNHALGKNMIGAFHQPSLVWCDTAYLPSLPRRELVSGLGEVVKYGIILDRRLFAWLEEHLPKVLAMESGPLRHIVERSATLKAKVVANDEHEHGLRMVLNHGHTIGHALEAAAGFRRLRHGEAVLLGLRIEATIAAWMGWLPEAEAERIARLVDRLPVPRPRVALADVHALMGRDKKNRRGVIRFVLPTSIGRVQTAEGVDPRLVTDAIRATLPGAH